LITLKHIRRQYKEPIKRTFTKDIGNYISKPIIQQYLNKALSYTLTESDRDWLWQNGQHAGKYPHFNYLCTIYIHPLTIAQNCMRLAAGLEA